MPTIPTTLAEFHAMQEASVDGDLIDTISASLPSYEIEAIAWTETHERRPNEIGVWTWDRKGNEIFVGFVPADTEIEATAI